MARRTSKTLTEVELEFMQILWKLGESTPDGIQEVLAAGGRDITGGSIRKILAILMRKEYVARTKEGKAYVYRAIVRKRDAQGGMIEDMLDRVFGGSTTHMVAALLGSQTVADEDLETIERLIAELKNKE